MPRVFFLYKEITINKLSLLYHFDSSFEIAFHYSSDKGIQWKIIQSLAFLWGNSDELKNHQREASNLKKSCWMVIRVTNIREMIASLEVTTFALYVFSASARITSKQFPPWSCFKDNKSIVLQPIESTQRIPNKTT